MFKLINLVGLVKSQEVQEDFEAAFNTTQYIPEDTVITSTTAANANDDYEMRGNLPPIEKDLGILYSKREDMMKYRLNQAMQAVNASVNSTSEGSTRSAVPVDISHLVDPENIYRGKKSMLAVKLKFTDRANTFTTPAFHKLADLLLNGKSEEDVTSSGSSFITQTDLDNLELAEYDIRDMTISVRDYFRTMSHDVFDLNFYIPPFDVILPANTRFSCFPYDYTGGCEYQFKEVLEQLQESCPECFMETSPSGLQWFKRDDGTVPLLFIVDDTDIESGTDFIWHSEETEGNSDFITIGEDGTELQFKMHSFHSVSTPAVEFDPEEVPSEGSGTGADWENNDLLQNSRYLSATEGGDSSESTDRSKDRTILVNGQGSLLHELSHVLFDLPDLVDHGLHGGLGAGTFDLMSISSGSTVTAGRGCHLKKNGGLKPPMMAGPLRMSLGWTKIFNIDTLDDGESFNLNPAYMLSFKGTMYNDHIEPQTLLVYTNSDGGFGSSEFYLLEHRNVSYVEPCLPGDGGLLIYHIDVSEDTTNQNGYQIMEGSSSNFPRKHAMVRLVDYDGSHHLEKRDNTGDAGDTWFVPSIIPLDIWNDKMKKGRSLSSYYGYSTYLNVDRELNNYGFRLMPSVNTGGYGVKVKKVEYTHKNGNDCVDIMASVGYDPKFTSQEDVECTTECQLAGRGSQVVEHFCDSLGYDISSLGCVANCLATTNTKCTIRDESVYTCNKGCNKLVDGSFLSDEECVVQCESVRLNPRNWDSYCMGVLNTVNDDEYYFLADLRPASVTAKLYDHFDPSNASRCLEVAYGVSMCKARIWPLWATTLVTCTCLIASIVMFFVVPKRAFVRAVRKNMNYHKKNQ